MSMISPILFSGPMMRAICAGQKTQTRRLASSPLSKLKPGHRLYTREAFRAPRWLDKVSPANIGPTVKIDYEANTTSFNSTARLRPGIHQPRFMSRATLYVTDLKRERLQDITAQDAAAEGVFAFKESRIDITAHTNDPVKLFEILWDSLHGGQAGKTWADNPEIIAPVFDVVLNNIDKI